MPVKRKFRLLKSKEMSEQLEILSDPPAEHNCVGRQEEKSGREQGLLLHTTPWTTLLRVSPCQKKQEKRQEGEIKNTT